MDAWWVFALLLFGPLAGCIAPSTNKAGNQSAALHEFEAMYLLREKGGDGKLTLRLALGAPVTVADADLQLRPAYPLTVTTDYGKVTDYLDGQSLVRKDIPCGYGVGGGTCHGAPGVLVRWDLQGALPSFGIGWPQLAMEGRVVYRMLGQVQDQPLVRDEFGLGIPSDAPITYELFLNASNRYHYSGAQPWLPDGIQLHAAIGRAGQIFEGERIDLHVGNSLPAISPWPKPAIDRPRDLPPRLFSGAGRPVFNLDISYDQALDALLQQQPAARASLEGGGCVMAFGAMPIQGSSLLPPNLDVMAFEGSFFSARISDAHGVQSWWHWSYDKPTASNPNPTGLLHPAFTTSSGSDFGYLVPCVARFSLDLVSPEVALKKAWQLPLEEAGYPCALEYSRARFDNIWDHDQGPVAFEALLTKDVSGNRPNAHVRYSYAVTVDGQTGLWLKMDLPQADISRLDAGHWTPRPLPPPDSPPYLGAAVRCVEPGPTGG